MVNSTATSATTAATSATAPPSLQSVHIHHLISVKLDNNNYLLWLTQFQPLLKGYDLEGFVDGTNICPPRLLEAVDGADATPNPAYTAWQRQDQILLGWLLSSLTEPVLAQVVGMTSSREVWQALQQHFSSRSKSRILHLRRELHNVKKGSKNMQQYFLHVKQLADSLAASGTTLFSISSMAEAASLLPLVLSLLLLSIGNEVQCFEGGKTALSLQKFQWRELKDSSHYLPQKSRRERGAMILEMQQKDYCSGQIKNWDETLQNRLVSDDRRVQSLQTRIKNTITGSIEDVTDTQIPLTSGAKLETLNYIVTVELGGKEMEVIVDTGSDLTWIQCQPCISCYDQKDLIFNPGLSQSYRSIMCSSPTCQSLSNATGNAGVCGADTPSCNYFVSYGDGSFTRGQLALESLNLSSTVVPDFVFGCGQNNKGLFGGASGILGLGRSQLSLVAQTSTMFDGIFSYCLPSTDAEDSGSLTLGGNFSVYKNSTPIAYTSMVSNPDLSTFYLLNLTGLSIGGLALQAPGLGKSGILIDSGTVITRLVPSVYRALRTEFLKQFSGYPPAPAFSILDTCFNLTGYEEVDIPTMKLQFEDSAEMTVDVSGMFYFVRTDASQVCLAIASLTYEDELGILGNYQQRHQRIIYDTKKSKLGFAKEVCGYT